MIRILLAEDQAMVRGALSALLNLESDIEVLGSAADGEAAWRELQRLKPDVLVTDIEMPGLSGLELAQRAQRHALASRVVIVTTFARPGFLRRALEAGVSGYLLKDAPAEQLAEALRTVVRGGRAIDPQLAVEAWSEADPLSDRERQVLRLAGEGSPAAEIAQRLGEAFQTTKPEGVGLGLAVARQVAEGHGGCLRYARTEDATCFELSLPAGDQPPPAPPSAAALRELSAGPTFNRTSPS